MSTASCCDKYTNSLDYDIDQAASFYKDSRSYDTLEGSKAVARDFVSFKFFISKLPLKRQGGITDLNRSHSSMKQILNNTFPL